MEPNMFTQNTLKATLLLQPLLIMSPRTWLFTNNKFSVQFWFAWESKPFKKLLNLSIQTHGETVLPFSPNLDLQLENSKIRYRPVKSESTFQFQFHSQCSLSPEARDHSMEIWTFTVKTESNFSPNGKQ